MRLRDGAAIGGVCGLVAVIAWWVLDSLPVPVQWVEGVAPTTAVVGTALPVRLHLTSPGPSGFLVVDLHWTDRGRRPARFLSGTPPLQISQGIVDYHVAPDVPDRPGIAFVYLVVYVSPTGQWTDHRSAAISGPVPVERIEPARHRGQPPSRPLSLVTIPARREPVWNPGRSPVLRDICGWLLASSGVVLVAALFRHRRGWHIRRVESPINGLQAVLAAGFLVGGIWELLDLERRWANDLRSVALSAGLYFRRETTQHALTALLFAALVGATMGVIRMRRSGAFKLTLVAWMSHAVLATAGLVSLHGFDALTARNMGGVSLYQALKLAAAVIGLGGAVAVARRDSVPISGNGGATATGSNKDD